MYESSTKTPQSACFKRLGLGFTLVVRYCEVIYEKFHQLLTEVLEFSTITTANHLPLIWLWGTRGQLEEV